LRIDREIGGGGMSRVFVATEIALGRFVAVKVLLPELAHGISVERFRREVTVSARLQHPHIVPLLAAGEALGLPYYTMPLVEGESLRARLNRNGPLAVPDAIRLLREVASALGYAHGKGVVHRDIKPENILLTGSHAMVTDFGIAKALSVATERDRPVQTEFGATLGTPAYMAPEQVVGDASIDHRADLYALGTVAYEVLCGRTPFGNRPPAAMLGAQVSEAPESIAQACAGTPPRLAALVMRCLEKRPGDRPPSSDDLLRELEASSGPDPTPERPARVSIAVLPMVNTSGDVESEPFSDGLTDELIGALGKVESLTVSGRTSTFALKGKGLEIAQIAAHLRVNHLLEGSVRRSGQRLRIRVQLVDAEGRILWSTSTTARSKTSSRSRRRSPRPWSGRWKSSSKRRGVRSFARRPRISPPTSCTLRGGSSGVACRPMPSRARSNTSKRLSAWTRRSLPHWHGSRTRIGCSS